MWGYRKSIQNCKEEKKIKARKFRVIGNNNCHGYNKGQIVNMKSAFYYSPDDCGIIAKEKPNYHVLYSDMEEITDTKLSLIHRLYTAIIGALFGHESHSRNRY